MGKRAKYYLSKRLSEGHALSQLQLYPLQIYKLSANSACSVSGTEDPSNIEGIDWLDILGSSVYQTSRSDVGHWLYKQPLGRYWCHPTVRFHIKGAYDGYMANPDAAFLLN